LPMQLDRWNRPVRLAGLVALVSLTTAPLEGQTITPQGQRLHLYAAEDFGIDPGTVTFSKDIAPILQRSCENCHRAGGGGPMALTTYDEVRPWASVIRLKTAIRDRMGAMPPYYLEKDIGIQHYKQDPSLSDVEL